MSESVYILGGGRTDFKRNLKKEGKAIRHIIIEAGKKAIDDAKIDPGEIQAGAVGNFNAGQFTKQLQLGAFIPEIDPKLRGIPTMHTEAACASGALSVLLGAEWIIGGFYDVVLVIGAEQQKTMSSLDGSDVLGAAADYHNEKPEYGDFMFPKLFGRIAQIYIEKYGATESDLAQVAWKNYAHAKLNPFAQMRDADLTLDCASQVSDENPSVAPPLKVSDCSQITDGAASVLLVSGKIESAFRDSGQCRWRTHRRRPSRGRNRGSPSFRSVSATHRTGWRSPDRKREKIPHVQHGRQPHDFSRHGLGSGLSLFVAQ